jgi:hypothetical protein
MQQFGPARRARNAASLAGIWENPMTIIRTTQLATAAALAAALFAMPALAASQSEGVTSGPATGTSATPNTAVTKHSATANENSRSTASDAQHGAMGAGAPGVSGKTGTESGPNPHGATGNGYPAQRKSSQ